MSDNYLAIKNKHSKLYFQKYLSNIGEPADDIANDLPPELEAEMLENNLSMKRKFRLIAQRLRNHR